MITLGGVDIVITTEAMCLGVLLDSSLTFAPHARRLSGKSFYSASAFTHRKSHTGFRMVAKSVTSNGLEWRIMADDALYLCGS